MQPLVLRLVPGHQLAVLSGILQRLALCQDTGPGLVHLLVVVHTLPTALNLNDSHSHVLASECLRDKIREGKGTPLQSSCLENPMEGWPLFQSACESGSHSGWASANTGSSERTEVATAWVAVALLEGAAVALLLIFHFFVSTTFVCHRSIVIYQLREIHTL